MDNESKILIEKLIEAIDSPDWWIIVITLINAIIMLWLGWRQYKLQKQQTYLQKQQVQQQEYELYKQMYIQIDKVEIFIEIFLSKLVVILFEWGEQERINEIDKIINDAKSLGITFMESTYDIELKGCGNVIDVQGYYDALQEIKYTTMYLKYMLEKDMIDIHINKKVDVINDEIYLTKNNAKLASLIVDCCNDEYYQKQLKKKIFKCVDMIDNANKSHIRDEIKKRIASK